MNMKSLSPNAQEFIPFNQTQTQTQSIQTFLIDPSTGATSPIILSNYHQTYQNESNLPTNQIQASTSTKITLNQPTQHQYYSNHQMPLHIIMPSHIYPQPIPHHHHHHPPTQSQPLQPSSFQPQYNYPYIPVPPHLITNPGLVQPVSNMYPPVYNPFKKNEKKLKNFFIKQPHPQPHHQQHNHNQLNNFNSINSNQNNKTQYLTQQTKTNTFEINDDEWPSLNVDNKKTIDNNNTSNTSSTSSHNNNKNNENKEKSEKVPYIEDEAKFKKVVKNVNLIKQTIEQHYLYETNQAREYYKKKHSLLQQQQQQKMATLMSSSTSSTSQSFKDAILNKPVKFLNKLSNSITNNTLSSSADKLQKEQQVLLNENVSNININKHKTNRCKRSKSKGTSKSRDSSCINDNNNNNNFSTNDKEFDLTKEDFPSLTTSNVNCDEKISEANSSADVVNDKDTNKIIEQSTDNLSKQASKSSNKLLQPIKIEFANMISALEKSQNNELINKNRLKKPQPFNFNPALASNRQNAQMLNNSNLIRPQPIMNKPFYGPFVSYPPNYLVNPLDPNSIIKRGKEREKPKNKKKSTLKKIILREREEKRRQRDETRLNIEQLPINLNSPMSNLSDLFLSPNKSTTTITNEEKTYNEKQEENEAKADDLDKHEHENESEQGEEENEEEDEEQEQEQEQEQDDDENEEENEEHVDEEEETNSIDNNTEIMSPISQQSPISINGYTPSPYAALNLITNDRTLISLEKLEEQVKQKIHSRRFREYCNQIINRDIDFVCASLLHEIVRFQDRLYHKNPLKAKMKRRYVMGIREVTKHLKLQKLKCVILAPNCEKIESKGGLDDAINFIIQTSMEQNIPFLFALGRKGLGRAVNKLVPISVIGIFDYSGAEEHFKRLVELANNAKLAYQEMVEEFEREECENLIMMQSNVVNTLNQETEALEIPTTTTTNPIIFPKIPSHMAHSRTPSNGSNISIEPFYQMNYHTHSRSASGNFNYGHTTVSGHSRSASGGGGGTLNIDLNIGIQTKHWTHSRTPSNCSNISFISRLSEPISEVGGSVNQLINSNSSYAAVNYYIEQVRQEMKENVLQTNDVNININTNEDKLKDDADNSSLANLHLGCINEIDAGNEADIEDLVESTSDKLMVKMKLDDNNQLKTENDKVEN